MYLKPFVSLAVVCVLSAFVVGDAQAQLRSGTSRGTAKVRSRLFNPFDVSGSQVAVDRFGIVSYRSDSSRSAASVTPYWASAAAFSAIVAPAAPVTTTASTAAAGASSVATVSAAPTSGSLDAPAPSSDLAFGSSVRPPYRPPVRSPFRPPPRPPFIP